jgi:heparan-alpha-glucosaminide N-acetyltransferase
MRFVGLLQQIKEEMFLKNNNLSMTDSATNSNRILSIDIMRGLTMFLMLFVNDLFEPGVPAWMVHTKGHVDGMGLADWVFPGFLFMVGMSIPYAIGSRMKIGESKLKIFLHIILRTLSLLLIGVFMLNSERLNPELSGIKSVLYNILMYVSFFLIWNKYPDNKRLKKLFWGLKILGVVVLIGLASLFKAGEPGHVSWFETGWWGILGLIGWGYLVAAMASLFIGPKLVPTIGLWLLFIGTNILSQSGMLGFLNFLNPVFGVILGGNVPMIVLAGLTIGVFLKQSSYSREKIVSIIAVAGILSLAFGFFLRNWFIISKIQGTPSWGMICNGISMIVFALLFWIMDIQGKTKWAAVFKPAGQNSLTTYLAPDILYFVIWGLSLPLFFYKRESSQLLAVCGSLIWALSMVGFTALLAKINIRLKL